MLTKYLISMNNISLLTYTHSKCEDIHEVYFDRIKKFFTGLQHNYVTCDKLVKYAECIVYENSSSHSNQMINALDIIPTDYVIYSQEDYILFDKVKEDKLVHFTEILDSNPKLSYIRLIQSGVGENNKEYNEDLMYVDRNGDYFYSTQVSVWRKSHLKKMFEFSRVSSIFEEPINSPFLKYMGGVGLYTKSRGKKVGGHYNSDVYPYIATAKVKGQWNIEEYQEEIQEIFKEYGYLQN